MAYPSNVRPFNILLARFRGGEIDRRQFLAGAGALGISTSAAAVLANPLRGFAQATPEATPEGSPVATPAGAITERPAIGTEDQNPRRRRPAPHHLVAGAEPPLATPERRFICLQPRHRAAAHLFPRRAAWRRAPRGSSERRQRAARGRPHHGHPPPQGGAGLERWRTGHIERHRLHLAVGRQSGQCLHQLRALEHPRLGRSDRRPQRPRHLQDAGGELVRAVRRLARRDHLPGPRLQQRSRQQERPVRARPDRHRSLQGRYFHPERPGHVLDQRALPRTEQAILLVGAVQGRRRCRIGWPLGRPDR